MNQNIKYIAFSQTHKSSQVRTIRRAKQFLKDSNVSVGKNNPTQPLILVLNVYGGEDVLFSIHI